MLQRDFRSSAKLSVVSLFALQTDTFHEAGQIGFIVASLVFSLPQHILTLLKAGEEALVGRSRTSAAAAEQQQFFEQLDNLQ
jgi:hypothetical protein